ncbi:MAG TPA: hypothetical protein IAA66_04350 [Candidatus Avichristensenella intestinipullorum]|uniref:Carbohydrate ABC transporter permease n=1 Tax=Candidatus Avichristensenella intestinipullorum TaxID=2840693 RepID=A0A9D0YVG2_9FIRM|nr:hypothetical protein [Candidatus Avichristensenella intestinipullorum]
MKIRRWLVTGIIRTILLLWSVMVIYPLVWMFLSAFKTTTELYTTPWALPSAYLPDNFIIAWDRYMPIANWPTSFDLVLVCKKGEDAVLRHFAAAIRCQDSPES